MAPDSPDRVVPGPTRPSPSEPLRPDADDPLRDEVDDGRLDDEGRRSSVGNDGAETPPDGRLTVSPPPDPDDPDEPDDPEDPVDPEDPPVLGMAVCAPAIAGTANAAVTVNATRERE